MRIHPVEFFDEVVFLSLIRTHGARRRDRFDFDFAVVGQRVIAHDRIAVAASAETALFYAEYQRIVVVGFERLAFPIDHRPGGFGQGFGILFSFATGAAGRDRNGESDCENQTCGFHNKLILFVIVKNILRKNGKQS